MRLRAATRDRRPHLCPGKMIEGNGNAVVADFVAGAAERLVLDSAPGAEVVVVEGQGSLLHPGYSGVTLGLMHGAMPQALILCTKPQRTRIYGGSYDWVEIPPLDEIVRLHEEAMTWVCPEEPARVVAMACNTHGQREEEALQEIERAERLTGLPATDPIRFGAAKLAEAALPLRKPPGWSPKGDAVLEQRSILLRMAGCQALNCLLVF